MWSMPWPFVNEIYDAIIHKQEKEQEAIRKSQGKSTKTF